MKNWENEIFDIYIILLDAQSQARFLKLVSAIFSIFFSPNGIPSKIITFSRYIQDLFVQDRFKFL